MAIREEEIFKLLDKVIELCQGFDSISEDSTLIRVVDLLLSLEKVDPNSRVTFLKAFRDGFIDSITKKKELIRSRAVSGSDDFPGGISLSIKGVH